MSQISKFPTLNQPVETIVADNGIAIPAGGVLNVLGGLNINTAAVGNTLTINLDNTVHITGTMTADLGLITTLGNVELPDTDATGTQGEIRFGGHRWISNFGPDNTFVGDSSGNTTNTGTTNVGVGSLVLSFLTSGSDNTVVGSTAGLGLTSGIENTALGSGALGVTTGRNNIAIGIDSGAGYIANESSNICIGNFGTLGDAHVIRIGTDGTGVGQQNNTYIAGNVITARSITAETGNINAIVGDIIATAGAMNAATTVTAGTGVTAVTGDVTLDAGNLVLPDTNTAGTSGEITFGAGRFVSNYGVFNTFVGSLSGNTTLSGRENAGFGSNALLAVTTGDDNTALGTGSLLVLTSGNHNTAVGVFALDALIDGIFNIALGAGAGLVYNSAQSSNICIGNTGVLTDSHVIRIGSSGSGDAEQNKCFIAGISGITPDVAGAGLMIIDSSSQLGSLGSATDGQIPIGSTGANPVLTTLTAGAGIGITNAAGSITITNTGGGGGEMTWTVETVDLTAVVNHGYIANKSGLLTITLPAVSAIGDVIRVTNMNTAFGWKIAQGAGQQIHFGPVFTTLGVTGYLASSNEGDGVELVCVVANKIWFEISSVGGITVA